MVAYCSMKTTLSTITNNTLSNFDNCPGSYLKLNLDLDLFIFGDILGGLQYKNTCTAGSFWSSVYSYQVAPCLFEQTSHVLLSINTENKEQ